MLSRKQKKEIVKQITEKLKDSKSVVFVDYSGTSVSKLNKLRKELRHKEVVFKITKKKLFDIALRNAGIGISTKELEGQIGMAISIKDEVSAAKTLIQFSKENPKFKVLSGVLEKKLITRDKVEQLANLPTREELLAKLIATINAPLYAFVRMLSENISKLVRVLNAVGEIKR